MNNVVPSITRLTISFTAHYRSLQALVTHSAYVTVIAALMAMVIPATANAGLCDVPNTAFCDDFETDKGWVTDYVATDTATAGIWERSFPQLTEESPYVIYQPGTVVSGAYSLVTDGRAGHYNAYDVDYGTTSISSPAISLPAGATSITLSFHYFFGYRFGDYGTDGFFVYIDDASSSQLLYSEMVDWWDQDGVWSQKTFDLTAYEGDQIRIRFAATDIDMTTVEAGVDDLIITYVSDNAPPSITSPGNQANLIGTAVTLPISVSDADNDPVTCSAAGLPSGLSINSSSCVISGTITGGVATYPVTLTASDGQANSQTNFNWTVTSGPAAPVVTNPGHQSGVEGDVISLQIQASDANNDTLSYSASGLPSGLSINTNTGFISGTIAVGASTLSPFNPLVTVSDGSLSDQVTFPWTVLAQPPEPVEVFYDSFENGAWNALWTQDASNDWFVSTQRATQGSYSAEVDGSASDAELISIPIDLQGSSEATITFNWYIESGLDSGEYLAFDISTNGGVSWSEVARLRGNVDSENTWHTVEEELWGLSSLQLRFRGQMSRSSEDANVDEVQVTVPDSNSAPSITNPGNQTTEIGSYVDLDIAVSDPDGDDITCGDVGLPDDLMFSVINSTTCNISGIITASTGDYPVTLTASDDNASTSVQFNWEVTAPPTPPDVTNPGNQVDGEGDVINLQIQASDVNDDQLIYSASGLPLDLSINSSTGLITGTIQSGASGSSPYAVTITVDAGIDSVEVNFQWTVTEQNLDPELTLPPTQSNNIDTPIWLQIDASDPESQPITFTATGLPPGLTIDASTGLISGTVSSSALGSYTVNVTVYDGVNATQDSFIWKVYNLNVITELEFIWVNESNNQFKLAWRYASDPNGPTYTSPQYFEIRPGSIQAEGTTMPSNVLVSNTAGNLMWQSGTIDADDYVGSAFLVSACVSVSACSNGALVNLLTMDAGHDLEAVSGLSINQLNEETGTFKLQWSYSNEYFYSANGKPDYFEIRPALTQPGGDVTITVTAGSSIPSGGWQTATLDDDDYIGAAYFVSACFYGGSCGEASVATVNRAGIDPSLPQPNWTNGQITGADQVFSLSWSAVADERVDFFTITEVGELGELLYYTEETSLDFTRSIDGDYDFTLQACHRDRQNGDTCSTNSSVQTVGVAVTVPPPEVNLSQPTNLIWYWLDQGANKAKAQWQYPAEDFNDSSSTPDYFRVLRANAFPQGAYDHSVLVGQTVGPYTWASQVMDLSIYSPSSLKYVAVKACKNDGTCGESIYINMALDQPSAPPAMPPISLVTPSIPGGPDDHHPGQWWDPNRVGTGWSFHWASELRYPSVHESHGDTYDLVAFWLSYAQIDGVWRPAWFFSQLKYENEVFQGALYYARHTAVENPCPNLAKTCHQQVGQLTVDYGDDNNVQSQVSLVMSTELAIGLPDVSGLTMQLNHFAHGPGAADVGSIESPYDHYSGMWWHRETNGVLNEDFAVLSWLYNQHESALVLFYDDEGRPTWVRSDNESQTTNAWHVFDGIKTYAVIEGFDPTQTNSTTLASTTAGSIGRRFDDYREGGVWLDLDANHGRTAELEKGGPLSPISIEKATSFHDVRFFIGSNDETVTECFVATGQSCNLTLNWFTDDFYPDATVYLRNLASNQGTKVDKGFPTVTDYPFALSGEGDYQFELWKKDSTDFNNPTGNAKIAESQVLTITETGAAGVPETPPVPEGKPAINSTEVAASSRIGATAGQFRVDESGNANYSIPILTAPGSGGVAPQISFDYNSAAPNGLLGVGWNLGGLSIITRCAQTAEQDPSSTVRGVTLTENDRFCLDGQRLMLKAGTGNYGENKAEYRTEIDGIAKIVSYGSPGSGPTHFRVWRKDGSVTEYGVSGDSRIEAKLPGDTDTVFAWAQNRMEDSAGNYILYEYEENTDTDEPVEFVLDKISYTGNSTSPATAPYAFIDFIYGDRTDGTTSYMAGTSFGQSKILTRVDSKAKVLKGDSSYTSLRSYVLTYDPIGDGHGREVLSEIDECDNAAKSHCFAPTRFEWLKSEHEFGPSTTPSFSLPDQTVGYQLADVNGDGRPDLLYTEELGSTYYLRIALATESGDFSASGSSQIVLPEYEEDKPVQVHPIDLNADGFQDIIYTNEISGTVYWYGRLSTGTDFGIPQNLIESGGLLHPNVVKILDYDGDGLSDLMHSRPNPPGREFVVWRNTFTPGPAGQVGFEPIITNPVDNPVIDLEYQHLFPDNPAGWVPNYDKPQFAGLSAKIRQAKVFDYNGDGAVDILTKLSREYCDETCDTGPPPAGPGTQVIDIINLDDESDGGSGQSSGAKKTVAYWVVFESDRQGGYVLREVVARDKDCDLTYLCNNFSDKPIGSELQPVDINNDGLADLMYMDEARMWRYLINTGTSFLTADVANPTDQDIGQTPLNSEDWVRMQDVNGDGFVDFLYPSALDSDGATWKVHFNTYGGQFSSVMGIPAEVGNTGEGDVSLLVDFTGDGKLDHLFINNSGSGTPGITFRKGRRANATGSVPEHEASNVITKVTNSFGAETVITYLPLTHSDVYTRMRDSSAASWGEGAVVYDLIAPIYVVSAASSSAPTQGSAAAMSNIDYHYVGAKLQAGGRGFLGFGEVVSYDRQSKIRTNTRYRQDHPYIGMPVDTTQALVTSEFKLTPISNTAVSTTPTWPTVTANTLAPSAGVVNGVLLSYAINEWAARATVGGAQFPYIIHSLERSYTRNGTIDRRILTTNTYNNDYANLDNIVIQTYDGADGTAFATQTTANAYSDQVAEWFLGRLTTSTVTHQRTNQDPVVRKSKFAYDSNTGILIQEIIEPKNNTLEVTTNYTLDRFGNRKTATVVGRKMDPRISTYRYDDLGRFVIETINAYGQTTSEVLSWDVYGNALEVADINGVITDLDVDYMGRVFMSYTPTGAWSKTINVAGWGSQCKTDTVFYTLTTGGGSPDQYQCFDVLGREIRSATEGFDGSMIRVDRYYDSSGRVAQVSEPHYVGASIYWNISSYDELGRILILDGPEANDKLMYSYDEDAASSCIPGDVRRVLVTNDLGQERLELKNTLGETAEVYDDNCHSVVYEYDAVGNLTFLTADGQDPVEMQYDLAGRKIWMDDPDKGIWEYAYNPLGELTRQLDSKDQAIDFEYDLLGRVTDRYEQTGASSLNDSNTNLINHEVIQYENGSGTGRAQPDWVEYRSGAGSVLQRRDYIYDNFGRVEMVSTTIGSEQFAEETTYDQYGRVFQQFDASDNNNGLRYVYTDDGYLDQVKEARYGTTGTVYQDIVSMGPRGQVTKLILGNGVEASAEYYDDSGRLKLLSAKKGAVTLQDVEYIFDILGNLKHRIDSSSMGQVMTEDFGYDSMNRLKTVYLTAPHLNIHSPTLSLSLNYNNAGNITYKSGVGSYGYGNNAGPHAVTSAGGVNYTYDANGNQETGDGRIITYTVFDKADSISKGTAETEFNYGIGNARYQRVDLSNGNVQKTTLYLGSTERITEGGNPYFKRYLAGVAIATFYPTSGVQQVQYLLKDHIGSIHTVTNDNGLIVETMHFSAFGERQGGNWQTTLSSFQWAPLNDITTRGFTGHEQMDEMGIIHMNGRIYDPKLGRMLQADPFVQDPKNSQSLNRYTYVLNNPLSYTDPSGYFSLKSLWKKVIRPIVAYAVYAVGMNYFPALEPLWRGISTYIASGSIKGSLIGAFSSIIHSTINVAFGESNRWGRMLAHATTEIAMDEARRKWVAETPTQRHQQMTILRTAGGTDSGITAGNFINGANTSSFAYSSNDEKRQAQKGLFGLAVDKVTDFGQSIVDEVAFGANAVVSGVVEDYQAGGVLGVIIGATGGPTDRSFFDQVNSDYASTSLIIGPIANVDKKLTGILFAGAVTRRYGGYTFGQLIFNGPALHLGTYGASARLAAATTIVNSVIITASYEGGSYAGSLMRASINRTARFFE